MTSNYAGILESVLTAPGRFDAVAIKLEGDSRTYLLNLSSGHIVCDSRKVSVPEFFAWLAEQQIGEVKAVLVPSPQHYGRIVHGFFSGSEANG